MVFDDELFRFRFVAHTTEAFVNATADCRQRWEDRSENAVVSVTLYRAVSAIASCSPGAVKRYVFPCKMTGGQISDRA